jgi:hypothetical protein
MNLSPGDAVLPKISQQRRLLEKCAKSGKLSQEFKNPVDSVRLPWRCNPAQTAVGAVPKRHPSVGGVVVTFASGFTPVA